MDGKVIENYHPLKTIKIIAILEAIENYRSIESKWKSNNFILSISDDSLKSLEQREKN